MITPTMTLAEQTLEEAKQQIKEVAIELLHDEEYTDCNDWWGFVVEIVNSDRIPNIVDKFNDSGLLLTYNTMWRDDTFYKNDYYGYDKPETLQDMNVIIAYSLVLQYLEENMKQWFQEERKVVTND